MLCELLLLHRVRLVVKRQKDTVPRYDPIQNAGGRVVADIIKESNQGLVLNSSTMYKKTEEILSIADKTTYILIWLRIDSSRMLWKILSPLE